MTLTQHVTPANTPIFVVVPIPALITSPAVKALLTVNLTLFSVVEATRSFMRFPASSDNITRKKARLAVEEVAVQVMLSKYPAPLGGATKNGFVVVPLPCVLRSEEHTSEL